MKHLTILFVLVCLGYVSGFSQARLNGYITYVFDDRFDTRFSATSYFNGTIKGGTQWGAGLEYTPNEDLGIEILFLRQDTEAPISYWRAGPIEDMLNVGINYVLLSGAIITYPDLMSSSHTVAYKLDWWCTTTSSQKQESPPILPRLPGDFA